VESALTEPPPIIPEGVLTEPSPIISEDEKTFINMVFDHNQLLEQYLSNSVAELINERVMTATDEPAGFALEILSKAIINLANDKAKLTNEATTLENPDILNKNIDTISDIAIQLEKKRAKSAPQLRGNSPPKLREKSPRTKRAIITQPKPKPEERPLDITTTEHIHKPLRSNSVGRKLEEVHRARDLKPKSNENVSPYIKTASDNQLDEAILNEAGIYQAPEYRGQLIIEKKFRLTGDGLRRRVGRPVGSGILKPFKDRLDNSLGIQPMANYISFGKYAINTRKLNDDIVSIRHKTGGNIMGHPSRKVSPNLAKVFRKIIGNGLPDFEDLSNLSQDERQYLYDVSKKADIVSKLNIPAPSRDQQDKDNHSFEVMKGELLSGNDSVEMVKKFKLLMLKMSKSGTLPKAQVNELLTDLAELGY